jgi:hypothetical protein
MSENKIILRSAYKIPRCWMEPAKNPSTGRFPEVVRKVNSQGDMILDEEDKKNRQFLIAETEIIEVFDGRVFDLDDEVDRAWWEAIRFSKKIAQDRWERDKNNNLVIDGNARRYGTAEFYVERPGLEAKQRNDRKREIHEAKTYVYGDSPENLYNKVRLLGNPMPGSTISDVEDYLIMLAERSPQLITQLYTGSDTHLRLFLLDAQDAKVIFNKDKLYYYGDGIVLGATDSAVLAYFKNPDNKKIVDMIKRDTYPELYTKNIEVDAYDSKIVAELTQTLDARSPLSSKPKGEPTKAK